MGRRWDEIKGLVLIWESFRPKGFSSGPGRKRHDVVCADGRRSAPASEGLWENTVGADSK